MDRELVEQLRLAQLGSLEAFGYVIAAFRADALRMAGSHTKDSHLAEDSVQEAFMVAFRGLHNLRSTNSFPGWMKTIVRSCVLRALRRKQPDLIEGDWEGAIPDRQPDPSQHVHSAEIRELVRDAVKQLTPQAQELIAHYYVEGQSVSQISQTLGVPVGTVKRRLYDARQKLGLRLLGARPLPTFPKRTRSNLRFPLT